MKPPRGRSSAYILEVLEDVQVPVDEDEVARQIGEELRAEDPRPDHVGPVVVAEVEDGAVPLEDRIEVREADAREGETADDGLNLPAPADLREFRVVRNADCERFRGVGVLQQRINRHRDRNDSAVVDIEENLTTVHWGYYSKF